MVTEIQRSNPVFCKDLDILRSGNETFISNQTQTRKSSRALSWSTFLVSIVCFLLSYSCDTVHAHLNHTARALAPITASRKPSIRPTNKPRLVFASRSPSKPGTKKPGPSIRPTKKPVLVFGSRSPSQPGTKKPGSPPRIVFPSVPSTKKPTKRPVTKKPTVRPIIKKPVKK